MKRFLGRAALVALAAALASGCSDLFGPGEDGLLMTTDRTEYVAIDLGGEGSWRSYGVEVVVRSENVGRSILYLSTCGSDAAAPIFGVHQVEGEGVGPVGGGGGSGSAFSPAWACPGYPPIRLAPGEVRVDTLRLQGPTRLDGITGEVLGSLEGLKQIGFEVRPCPEVTACPSADLAGRSNPFRVSLPGGS